MITSIKTAFIPVFLLLALLAGLAISQGCGARQRAARTEVTEAAESVLRDLVRCGLSCVIRAGSVTDVLPCLTDCSSLQAKKCAAPSRETATTEAPR